MSTRANIILRDRGGELIFYRHSDGYPATTGNDLIEFCRGYATKYRGNVSQSGGWLIAHGHNNHKASLQGLGDMARMYEWKVGDYEPTPGLHGDVEFVYIIDLTHGILSCRVPTGWWDNPSMENTRPHTGFLDHHFKIGMI